MKQIAFSKPYFGTEEETAVAEVVRSRWVVGGRRLAEFEESFAAACGAKYAAGVSSWTTGAFLALKMLGIGPGDEVIVPSLTFIASVNVISHCGATPIFVDIDPLTYNIDPKDIEAKITPRTRAIVPVDQIGLPCEIDAVLDIARRHSLIVLHDAACAFGSMFRGRPIGCQAPVTVFSLHARKVVTTGEGGMIVTDDEDLAKRLKRQRHQGMSLSDFERHGASPTTFESYPEIGYNFRITDIQAAIGVVQLSRLADALSRRKRAADIYFRELKSQGAIELPYVPGHVTPNWQSFQIRVRGDASTSRNEFMERLFKLGIPTRRGVMASHLEPPYQGRATLPATEAAAAQCVQLPMHPELDEADVVRIADAISRVCNT